MCDLDYDFIINALDTSPKFRKQYIEINLVNNQGLIEQICELYKLPLIKEIYIQKLTIDTYNSEKRKKLKKQEILLINKLHRFSVMMENFSRTRNKLELIDNKYLDIYDEDFYNAADSELTAMIVHEEIKKYYENKKRLKK